MQKIHEKSRIGIMRADQIEKTEQIIIQALQIDGCKEPQFLCETVDPAEYDRATAEGRAHEAKKRLEEETEAHRIEMNEAEAKIEALEELLAQAKEERNAAREDAGRQRKENAEFVGALRECERIFRSLPPEIERLYKGEQERGYR